MIPIKMEGLLFKEGTYHVHIWLEAHNIKHGIDYVNQWFYGDWYITFQNEIDAVAFKLAFAL